MRARASIESYNIHLKKKNKKINYITSVSNIIHENNECNKYKNENKKSLLEVVEFVSLNLKLLVSKFPKLAAVAL